MKIAFFEIHGGRWDETTVNGGSETWVDRTSSIMSKYGNDVTVYSNPFEEHRSKDGVLYKKYDSYNGEEYDVVYLVRFCKDYFSINSKNIFCVAHDIILFDFTEEMYNSENMKGIFALSEWHKNFMIEKMPFISNDKMFLFSNGYDKELYGLENSIIKENAMVWSSRPERGLGFFTNKVLPLIRKEIPDFKIYLCSYCGINEKYYNTDGIKVIGYADKKTLSDLQKKCKIWIYPNMGYVEQEYDKFFFETFCISAVENAMAGNAIITNDGGGLSTTLNGYSELLKFDETSKMPEDEYAIILANKSIEFLKNEEYRLQKSKDLYNIMLNKTWENVTEDFYNKTKINYKYKTMKLIGFTCTYNEEKMIPYVMPYVERFGYDKFIVYDNMSTDNTVEMLKKYPFVEVRQYDTNGKFDEDYRINLFYKSIGECKGMIQNDEPVWMTWTDFDEVLYFPSAETNNVSNWLFKWANINDYNICTPQMVNLLSEHFPKLNKKFVHGNIKRCSIWGLGKKPTIFLVNDIDNVITEYGFHHSYISMKKETKDFSDDINVCAFHLKYIDYDYVFNKGLINNQRIIYNKIYNNDRKIFDEFMEQIESYSFPLELYFSNKLNCKINLLSGINEIK